MTDSQVPEFMEVLRGVTRVFPIRGDDRDVQQLGAAYFKALRRYPLSMVTAGAEVCIQRGKHFPKPAEWLANIPRPSASSVPVPVLSEREAQEYHRAERLKYEDAPCGCFDCQHAGVSEKPLRFVPEFTPEDTDRKVRDSLKDRIVTAGHWAHGLELAGYYRSKAKFYTEFKAMVARHAMAPKLFKKKKPPLTIVREPGQEG